MYGFVAIDVLPTRSMESIAACLGTLRIPPPEHRTEPMHEAGVFPINRCDGTEPMHIIRKGQLGLAALEILESQGIRMAARSLSRSMLICIALVTLVSISRRSAADPPDPRSGDGQLMAPNRDAVRAPVSARAPASPDPPTAATAASPYSPMYRRAAGAGLRGKLHREIGVFLTIQPVHALQLRLRRPPR